MDVQIAEESAQARHDPDIEWVPALEAVDGDVVGLEERHVVVLPREDVGHVVLEP